MNNNLSNFILLLLILLNFLILIMVYYFSDINNNNKHNLFKKNKNFIDININNKYNLLKKDGNSINTNINNKYDLFKKGGFPKPVNINIDNKKYKYICFNKNKYNKFLLYIAKIYGTLDENNNFVKKELSDKEVEDICFYFYSFNQNKKTFNLVLSIFDDLKDLIKKFKNVDNIFIITLKLIFFKLLSPFIYFHNNIIVPLIKFFILIFNSILYESGQENIFLIYYG